MKNKLFRNIFICFVILSSIVLVGCKEKDTTDYESIVSSYVLREERNEYITENFTLPKTISDKSCSWSSNNDAIKIVDSGETYTADIYYPESGKVDVTLTLSCGGKTRDFSLKVRAIEAVDAIDQLDWEYEEETIGIGYSEIALDQTITVEKGHRTKDYSMTWSISDKDTLRTCKVEDNKFKFNKSINQYAAKLNCKFVAVDDDSDEENTIYNFNVTSIYAFTENATFEENKAYYFGLYQSSKGSYYYCDGNMKSYYYLQTTTDRDSAISYYVENGTNANTYYIYFYNGDTKTYIRAYVGNSSSTEGKQYNDLAITTSKDQAIAFTYDEAKKGFYVTLSGHTDETEDGNYYLGTSGTFHDIDIQLGDTNTYLAKLYSVDDVQNLTDGDKALSSLDKISINFLSDVSPVRLDEIAPLFDGVALSYQLKDSGNDLVKIEDNKVKVIGTVTSAKSAIMIVTATINETILTREIVLPILPGGVLPIDFEQTPDFESWGQYYRKHEFTVYGVKCSLNNAVRSATVITNIPVMKGDHSTPLYATGVFTLIETDIKITSFDFVVEQWVTASGVKKNKECDIYYTTDGSTYTKFNTTSYECKTDTTTISVDFSQTTGNVVGIKAVFVGSTNTSTDNQVGIKSLTLNVEKITE